MTGPYLALKFRISVDNPNKQPHLENSILQFIFVWVCYILDQNQLQMFKIPILLNMCLMLLYVKAFSGTIIMSVNRVSNLTRWITKWLKKSCPEDVD